MATKKAIAAHLEGVRWQLTRPDRLAFCAWFLGLTGLGSSADLSEEQGQRLLGHVGRCKNPEEIISLWRHASLPTSHTQVKGAVA